MIHDAEGALDSAEKELNEILDSWADDLKTKDEDYYYPSEEEAAEFLREFPPVPQPWEPDDPYAG